MKSTCQVFFVFDIETGGLKAETDAILEIAACPIDNELKDLPEYTTGIIKPSTRLINAGALKANGITKEQIEKGEEEKEAFEKFKNYLKSLKKGKSLPIPCGHNIDKFDLGFLFLWFAENGEDLGKYLNLDHTIDTLLRAREVWPEATNYKLGTCCQSVGISLTGAHRALNDTIANKELLKYFLQGTRGLRGKAATEEKRLRKTFEF